MTSRLRGVVFAGTVLITLGAWSLAVWQGSRLMTRRAANRVAVAARDLPVLHWSGESDSVPAAYRRVEVTGRWDPSVEIVLRGRVEDGTPGVLLVSGFRPSGGNALLLVNRGFVPSPDALTLPRDVLAPLPSPPLTSESLRIAGLAFPLPVEPDSGAPFRHGHEITWRRLDRVGVAHVLGDATPSLLPFWLLLERDTTLHGWPRPIAPPSLDDGPHLSYLLQWIGIGSAVLAFGIVFVLRAPSRQAPTSGTPPGAPPPPPSR